MAEAPRTPLPGSKTAALPAARLSSDAPIEAFGGGRHVEEIAAIGQAIYVREKRRADEVAVMEADRRLAQFSNNALYNNETGFINRRGKDALAGQDALFDSYEKEVGNLSNQLGNDDQRAAFGRFASSRRQELDKQVQVHVFNEVREHDRRETDAFVATERDAAALNYNDPERIQASLERQAAALRDFARRNGYGADSAFSKRLVASAISDTHVGVVNRFLANNQDQLAQDYYKANKASIDGKDATTLERALHVGSTRGESQRAADAIMSKEGVTREQALAEARRITNPEVREQTVNQINNRFNEIAVARRETNDALYRDAANIVESAKNTHSVPATTWSMLSLEQRNALENRARHLSAGTEPLQNWSKWVEFLDLSPTDLSKMNKTEFETAFRPYLDNVHFDRASMQWAASRDAAKDPKRGPDLSAMQTDKEMVYNAYSRAIGKPEQRKWNDDDRVGYGRFSDAASTAVQTFELTQLGGKRKATDEEKQKIVNGLLVQKVMIDRWGPDREKSMILLTDDEKKSAYVPIIKIPPTSLQRLVNLAKSYGSLPQDANIEQARNSIGSRLERAYGAALLGANDERIREILMGGAR